MGVREMRKQNDTVTEELHQRLQNHFNTQTHPQRLDEPMQFKTGKLPLETQTIQKGLNLKLLIVLITIILESLI